MKKILVVDYDNYISSYDFLEKLTTYEIEHANSYTDFKLKFEIKKYDLCILSIEDNIERDFIVYDILALDKTQSILQLVMPKSQCFFDKDCKNCEKYNIKSIFFDNNEKVLKYITSFETSICEFTKLNI
ncbi:hypothetical protein [Arcobacter arenosus]|uniref:hypothetical protein n=1 Tax=Arcobacter arenosus TaxID=2576037 RepID=UPI003BA84ED7